MNCVDPNGTFSGPVVLGTAAAGFGVIAAGVSVHEWWMLNHHGDDGVTEWGITLRGTRFTFRGSNYDELSCAAKGLIDYHEGIHQNQSFFMGGVESELQAWGKTVSKADALLRTIPLGSKERQDIEGVRGAGVSYFHQHGFPVIPTRYR